MVVSFTGLPRWAMRVGSLLLCCATAIAALFSLLALLMPFNLNHTIENSRQIMWSFQSANIEIEAYRKRTGKLPNSQEMSQWKNASTKGLLPGIYH